MGGLVFLILSLLNTCFCDWVLVPFVNTVKNESSSVSEKNYAFGHLTDFNHKDSCPDFHNLTMIGFARPNVEKDPIYRTYEITIEDIERIIKENKKIPKSSPGKTNFVEKIGENLMEEAEKRLKHLFRPGNREARFTSFHFPTMEGSLMTISMLLFGVYLSKLIVKLLQSHYAKYNMPIRMMGGIQRPVFVQNRKARSLELEVKHLYLMDLLENYDSRIR